MRRYRTVLACSLSALALAGACIPALATPYNDSSVTGGSEAWNQWVQEWETVATDYTKVSLTPGEDETQLNFAWYSQNNGSAATPVVHFGTDPSSLTAFTGTAAAVDTSLTDGVAYDYNHVTVTGLQENTTYYYTVEKSGVQTEPAEYKTGSFSELNLLYVGDPQVGASSGKPQGGEELVGVVLYAEPEHTDVRLAFLSADGTFQPMGIEATPASPSGLAYLGNGEGRFRLDILDENGQPSGQIITFRREGVTTYFAVEPEKE